MAAEGTATAVNAPVAPLEKFILQGELCLARARTVPPSALERLLDDLVWAAREYAAAMIEQHARPDTRWEPGEWGSDG